MQTQSPAGGEPAAPASSSPADAPGTAVAATSDPFISGSGPILWIGFGTFVIVFLLMLFFIMRLRLGGAEPAPRAEKTAKKPGKSEFFQPAGAEAEITFDDQEPAPIADRLEADEPVELDPSPAPRRRSLFGRSRTSEPKATAPIADGGGDLAERADEAEIIIERSEDASPPPPPAPRPRKPAPFSNLFGRKKRDEPPPEPANDETVVEIVPVDSEPEPASAESLSRSVFGAAARHEEADWRARLDAERRAAAEREAEERRAAAEESLRRDFDRRASAEREAEFEKNKLTASLEQRTRALEARERALGEREYAAASDAGAARADIAREFEAKFAELNLRLDRARRPAEAADESSATLREFDGRVARPAERVEQRPAAAGGPASDAGLGVAGEILARRVADHRDSINATLESMSNRIDMIAGAPQDVRALRDEIASLKRALGERVAGPNAPLVQLGDIVRNALPPNAYEMRAMLSNNRKADCLVRMPNPPGPIAVDARFPVEAFAKLHASGADADPRAENEFRRVALRHIVDIAERLIVPEETAESALMFIPSETMYAELHARFPDVVQDSFRARVWIVSPTTLMATLHTMRAVLRDAHARESADLIQLEAGHVLSEVEALRRRVVALEDNFNRVRDDFRGLLSSTDQVYRRAETISNSRRTLSDDALDRGSRRIPSVRPADAPSASDPRPGFDGAPAPLAAPPAAPASAREEGDLWEDRRPEETQKQPFPLR